MLQMILAAMLAIPSFLAQGTISHDIGSLHSWGPYSKEYFGISHINDLHSGIQVEFCLVPGVYRRNVKVPCALFESDVHPWYVSEDMRKAMEDYYRIKFKDKYMPTLEEKKAFVSFKSGLTLKQINEMSYRYFDIMYNQCIENDLFFSQKLIQASEKYKVNDEIVYPLFKKKNDKFDFLQNADAFEKKVSAAAKG
jgi:hypothetical protein